MAKKYYKTLIYLLIALLFILFLLISLNLQIFGEYELFRQFIGALLASIVTVLITALLLNQQHESEINLKCKESIFEKKSTVYHEFLKELHTLTEKENASINHKEIIQKMTYHLGLLQMHLSQEIINKLTRHISEIFGTDRIDNLHEYKKVSDNYFAIASLLGEDLYSANFEKKTSKTNIYNFAKAFSVIFDKELRDKKSMVEVHQQWWKIFISELQKKNRKLNLSSINNNYIEQRIQEFEEKKSVQFDFTLFEQNEHKIIFYFAYDFNSSIDCGFDTDDKANLEKYRSFLPHSYSYFGFGNPGIGAKHLNTDFDIDFYHTNFNYFAFASANGTEKRTLLEPFVNEINKDIKYFIKQLRKAGGCL